MTAPDLRPARILRIVGWIAAAWIAWEFLFYEQYKLTGNPGSVQGVFQPLADWFGIPAHEKIIRLGVASVEITASILVLIYPTRVLGAFLAFGLMSGAIFFHTIGPIGIDPYGDGGTLFKEACFTWAMAALILFIHRREARAQVEALLRHLPARRPAQVA
ncbi:hypothetical protein ACE7GA_14885 [Roseomonas sp. CCTCC AB2023176]|uniref:hypothetical protein n=1 Tax=Roseomonas sp. CCTCC AB2023176 TaxID=3342640 RepID=UPI0035D5D436